MVSDIITKLRNKEYIYTLSYLFLCLTLFLMSFPRSWSLYPLGIFLFLGSLIWIKDFSLLLLEFKKNIFLILPLVLYFLLHFIWFFFGKKLIFNLEMNLMFLLVPVFGFPLFSSRFMEQKWNTPLRWFIAGILIISFFELSRATWLSLSFENHVLSFNPLTVPDSSFDTENLVVSRFKSVQLSFIEHPTYLSIKVLFALSIMAFYKQKLFIRKLSKWLIISYFILFLFLLSSRAGIFIVLVLVMLYLYNMVNNFRSRLLVILISPLLFYGGFKLSQLNSRIQAKTDILINRYTEGKIKLEEIDPRFTSWYITLELMKEHPILGVGLDTKDYMAAEYIKHGYNNEAALNLNSHNQFLETHLMFGVPGTLVLVWMLLSPVMNKRILSEPALYSSFLIILLISFMFESVLVRQWGIMFFVLFYCIQVLMPKAGISEQLDFPFKKPDSDAEKSKLFM